MTVETAVKVEGEEKCGVEMRSDSSPSSVGVGSGCECNGGGDNSKDDYVFVNGSDVTSDDHAEVVVEVDGDRLDMDMCNGFNSEVDDNVVMVNGEELSVENGVVFEEKSDGGGELVKENGEMDVEDVIEDKGVAVENGDRIDNEGEVVVNECDLEAVEESEVKSKKDEVKVVEEGDECNVSVDDIACPSLDDDDDDNDKNGACDSLTNGSAVVESESVVPCGEIEEQMHLERCEEIEDQTKEPEKLEDEVRKSEVVEDNVNSHIDEVLVTESEPMEGVVTESEPVEADVVHHSQEDDHMEKQPPNWETKAPDSSEAEVLLLDDAIAEKQSTDCQQQDLQPADNGELGPVETEAEVGEQGDLDPPGVRGTQVLKSLDSEANVCELQQGVENQDTSDLTPESEECLEPQNVPEQSAGVDNDSNLALTSSELDGPALESSDQCDETAAELTQEVTGTLDTSTVDVQSDKFDKPADDHELDMVHGEEEVEVIAQVERSLECSVQEASPPDHVVEDTGLVDKEISSEDVISFNKATTVEETANSSMLKSADKAVLDEESKDLNANVLEDGVPENDVTVPETSHDSGIDLASDGGHFTVPSGTPVALPVSHDTDIMKEQGNLENRNGTLPDSVNCTEIEVKSMSDEMHDLSKNSDSEGTLRFGAFVCQTKANRVTTSLADVNAQIITDGVPSSSPERSGVSTGLTDAHTQTVTDGVSASTLEECGVSTSLTDADTQTVTDGVSASPLEESGVDSADGETTNPVRTPFRWVIKIPRLDDVEFEQIKKIQIELAKKTQDRDAFRKVYQERLDIYRDVVAKFHVAKAEKEASYQLMIAKKREIDSAQSLLKLARDGNTVERIDDQVRSMERRIQHETLDLAEEKRLVREIKQLNHQRERLAADTQGQQEVHQAVDRRVETEEQLKVLRKEMEVLRENYGKAFENSKSAERKCEEESKLKLKAEAEFKSLARVREEAYNHLFNLKKQAYEKNKPCYSYRDAKTAILNLKAGEEESLERLCVNQVENFMEQWNKNEEFRKEYIRCNMRSTLRRFNTLDGRDLGVDEKKPLLEDFSDNGRTSAKVNSVTTALPSEREFPLIVKKANEEDSSEKVIEQKNMNSLSKKRGEITSNNGLAEPSGRIETEEREEGPKLTKEEEELARKVEQKRREEEAERLKEQRRFEEKAKALEALERKKRMAEKAQARAKFKAEKEAEEKRKEREKRAKKKGKKRGITAEVEPAQVPEPLSETVRDPEVMENPVSVAKKSLKLAAFTKQVKLTKSIPTPPAPLRNRGKRRIPQWAWWLALAILTALLVFPLGNLDILGLLKPFVSGSSK